MAQALLSDLKLAVRQAADSENSAFYSETELARYVNNAIQETRDILVGAGQFYFVNQFPFTLTTTNVVSIAGLTGGFYKEVGLDYLPGGTVQPITVPKIDTFLDRNRLYGGPRYYITDTNLTVLPLQNYAGNYNLWYVPDLVPLVADSDPLPNELYRWKELIETSGGIAARIKREMDTTDLEKRLGMLIKRVHDMANNRSIEPAQIPYRVGESNDSITGWPWFGNGLGYP
jgi:hypothetical protein